MAKRIQQQELQETSREENIRIWAISCIIVCVLLLLGGLIIALQRRDDNEQQTPLPTASQPAIPTPLEPPPSEEPPEQTQDPVWETLQLHSSSALLYDRESGETIFARNADAVMPPASMTKSMTALVAIENIADLDEEVLLPTELFVPLYRENASMAGFLPEERVKARDLLYATLLPSGAEAACGLAEFVGGSGEAFLEMMNRRAAELGMTDTHYDNVTGLDSPELYSTASDTVRLIDEALGYEVFREIFTTDRYRSEPTDEHPNGLWMASTLFSRIDIPEFAGGRILGGKTGYTDGAGMCLVSLAEVNGKEYILVTLGAMGDPKGDLLHVEDAKLIYETLASLSGVE